MSKYTPLWDWIGEHGTAHFQLTFSEIENIAGLPIDHSFLSYKKELRGKSSQPKNEAVQIFLFRFPRIFPDRK